MNLHRTHGRTEGPDPCQGTDGARTPAAGSLEPRLRWQIRQDLYRVLEIERQSFADPWRAEDFITTLRQRNVIALVAEVEGGAIAGYVVYACEGKRLHLLNLAVAPEFRGRGIGKACIEKLKSKLGGPYRLRTAIFTEVREGNLPAQLFFRSMGFRACGIVSGWWQPYSDEGAYVFSFHAGSH